MDKNCHAHYFNNYLRNRFPVEKFTLTQTAGYFIPTKKEARANKAVGREWPVAANLYNHYTLPMQGYLIIF